MRGFEPYLSDWRLEPDGDVIVTSGARLLPVRRGAEALVLKYSSESEEMRGAAVLEWWRGEGAARVLAREGPALLMERASGPLLLSDMARGGRDDEACRILCAAALRLHARDDTPPSDLPELADWFGELWPAAARHGGILARAAVTARDLLAEPRDVSVLHGDLHHGNVLDFGPRGWLAIDPKGIIGERGFDYANIFTNPDFADPARPVATEPGRFASRLEVVTSVSGLERERLLCWILAWTGLSAAWSLSDGSSVTETGLIIAELATAELDR